MTAVAARTALSDLVHRYAAYVDDRQFAMAATLFTDTAELTVPDPPTAMEPLHTHRGHDAIATAVSAVAQVARTQHCIVGEVYDTGQRDGCAHGRIACVAHHWSERAADVVDHVWHLCYDDEYELTTAGWRFSRRALTVNALETRTIRRLRPRQ